MPEPVAQLVAGTLFHDRYQVSRCIRAGGMGAVYEVVDRTGRRRALKTMLPSLVVDPESRARFELEARVTAGVQSVHLCEVLDAGVDAATAMPFLVMELLVGEDLGTMVRRRERLAPAEVVTFMHQAALALDRTHAAGIVHRDLKPENLFVTRRDDGSPHLKILDFGIAKVVAESTEPSTTRSVGTPVYMAPEQIRGDGDIGTRADLYALGHIAYALLCGRPYYADVASSARGVYAVLLTVMEGAREPASVRARRDGVELPPAFDAWFAAATANAPDERFDHATTMIDELALALGVEPPRPSAVVDLDPSAADDGRRAAQTAAGISREARPTVRRSVVGLVAGIAVLVAAAAVVATMGGHEPPASAPAAAPVSVESAAVASTIVPALDTVPSASVAAPADATATASATPRVPAPPRTHQSADAPPPTAVPPKDPTRRR